MNKFKVGDMVNYYGGLGASARQRPIKGVVTSSFDELITIGSPGKPHSTVGVYPIGCHYKSCRKVKPKQKPREWRMFINKDGHLTNLANSFPDIDGSVYEYGEIIVREVIKK